MKSKKRIVLAYSGGLDTSIILKWLQENYDAEVICYTADIGQEINRKKIFSNARKFGVTKIIINDLKNIFNREISSISNGVIVGLGAQSYNLAVRALAESFLTEQEDVISD